LPNKTVDDKLFEFLLGSMPRPRNGKEKIVVNYLLAISAPALFAPWRIAATSAKWRKS
jgi:hypothetical protein